VSLRAERIWLMKKASLHGLAFRNDVDLDGDELKAPITDSYRTFMYGIYHWFSRPYYRPLAESPKVAKDGTEKTVNETIDASVFARWNNDRNYRPPNLVEWANRQQVNIEKINTSVLADVPAMPAPD